MCRVGVCVCVSGRGGGIDVKRPIKCNHSCLGSWLFLMKRREVSDEEGEDHAQHELDVSRFSLQHPRTLTQEAA